MDIFQIEARGMYSPPNGNAPQSLPDLWKPAPDEEIRTDLPSLSDTELNAIGWKGPIAMPSSTSHFTHSYQWNTETREYDATELDEFEKRRRVNYHEFWIGLINGIPDPEAEEYVGGSAYQKIKTTASQSLEVNTAVTEFIALLSDAKNKNANVDKIQKVLTEIVENIPFTVEELEEIQRAFVASGMFAVYTLQPQAPQE
jgi:hypothetical protein